MAPERNLTAKLKLCNVHEVSLRGEHDLALFAFVDVLVASLGNGDTLFGNHLSHSKSRGDKFKNATMPPAGSDKAAFYWTRSRCHGYAKVVTDTLARFPPFIGPGISFSKKPGHKLPPTIPWRRPNDIR